jgi:type IV pilus biogenesis protein CpaD/CtpE
MKNPVQIVLIVAMALTLAGCATEEEIRHRDAQRRKEDAQRDAERARDDARWEAEERRRDRERDEEDFQDYLEDYAYDRRKTKAELTSSERAAARREFNDRSRSRRYRYWY